MLSQSDQYQLAARGAAYAAPGAPDYDAAIECAREQLSRLPAYLTYHSLDHTFDEVMPAALGLARSYRLSEHLTGLLAVAVAFHDVGWTVKSKDHERAGIAIARGVLPRFGFSRADINLVAGMIQATRLPQAPTSLLEEIIADADLECLGCPRFWERSLALRREEAHFGRVWTDNQWWQIQIDFLQGHTYFTDEMRRLRQANKQTYIKLMRQMIEAEQSN